MARRALRWASPITLPVLVAMMVSRSVEIAAGDMLVPPVVAIAREPMWVSGWIRKSHRRGDRLNAVDRSPVSRTVVGVHGTRPQRHPMVRVGWRQWAVFGSMGTPDSTSVGG